MSDSPPAPQFSRRTIIQASAWSIPAIAAVTATPAYAATTGQVAITSVPQSTASCSATTERVTAQLSGGASTAGQLVQFSLPSGWSWRQGSGSYVSDGSGVATVPVGDIVAGIAAGTITASWGGSTAAASIPLTVSGTLTSDSSSALSTFPAGSNGRIVRVVSGSDGVVALTGSGDVWKYEASSNTWTSVGSGAATGPDQATYLVAGSRRGAWSIRNGVLYLDNTPDNFPAQGDVVRVFSGTGIGAVATSGGDVWKLDGSGTFTRVGTGGQTGPGQLAVAPPSSDGQRQAAVAWLKGTAVYFDSQAQQTPARQYIRLTSIPSLIVVLTSSQQVYGWSGQGWVFYGSNAATDAYQASGMDAGQDKGAIWIKNGQLQYNAGAGSVPSNQNFTAAVPSSSGDVVIAAKTGGDLWGWRKDLRAWRQLASGAATGPGQFAAYSSPSGAATPANFWIQPRTSC